VPEMQAWASKERKPVLTHLLIAVIWYIVKIALTGQLRSVKTTRRQGKPRLRTRSEGDEAITEILKRWRVEGLLQIEIQKRPIRASRGRLSGVRRESSFTLTCRREETARARAMSEPGWRVSATNHQAERVRLEQAVEASRDESLVERNFSRLKVSPLSLTPLDVRRDDHRAGLARLLTLALRVLTLLEGGRQRLGEQKEGMAGLFAGNPKRRTARPTAERLLEAFCEVTLTMVSAPDFAQRHVTSLSPQRAADSGSLWLLSCCFSWLS